MNKLFECIVGSQAYGTQLPTSDLDIKGIYIQPNSDILGFKYEQQVNVDKDTTYYEIKRFIELAMTANPTILEMLFVDDEMIQFYHSAFEYVQDNRLQFLTKKCYNSFAGFAHGQIEKAKGLNKKMNWEIEKTIRKTPLDFCYVLEVNRSIPLEAWLKQNRLKQEYCGLCAVDHFPGTYLLYYDWIAEHKGSTEYRGIVFEDSNDIRLTSISKGQEKMIECTIHYNKDAYSKHCREYNEYLNWKANRNVARYVDTVAANLGKQQKIDSKNMMHCIRMLDCAEEIARTGNLTVKRPNAEYLLSIRKGEVSLEDILQQATEKIAGLKELFDNSSLPDEVDKEFCHNLVNQVRKEYWK